MITATRNILRRRLLIVLLVTLVASTWRAPLALAGVNQWTSGGPVVAGCRALAVDPRNSETVYAGTTASVLRSRDGGRSWSLVFGTPSFGNWYSGLAIDPLFPDVVYAAVAGGVGKSTDAGDHWNYTEMRDYSYSIAIDPSSTSVLYAGTRDSLYKSNDGGASWTRKLATDIYSLVVSPHEPAKVFGADYDSSFYYGVPSTVHRSQDSGETWSSNVREIRINPGSLIIDPDPDRPTTMYAGSVGVYKSEDSGVTWRFAGLSSQTVNGIVLDPWNTATLYASTDRGVFRSTDAGATWRDFGRGLNGQDMSAIAIDATGTRLYAAALQGGGIYEFQILSSALDLSAGGDGRTHLLFVDPDHRAVFRNYDISGSSSHAGAQAVEGWDAKAVAVDSAGRRRVLWSHIDGSTALELEGPDGITFQNYGRIGDWTAVDVSQDPQDATVILWTNPDGRMAVWDVDASGTRVGGQAFGPFPGWLARAIAHGADGRVRVLWTNGDRRVGLSVIDAGGIVSTVRLAPPPGWTARDVTVSSDGDTRLLMVSDDDQMALWRVSDSGVVSAGPVYDAPFSGQSATRVSAGPDGVTRVLWTSPAGVGTLFLMGLDDVPQFSFGLD